MRVLFDGFWWARGPAANRTVQREFVTAWRDEFPDDQLTIAVRRADAANADVPTGIDVVTSRLWPHGVANALELGRLTRRVGADVAVTHNYAPLRGPSVTFIHDAMFRDHPEWFSASERIYFAGMLPTARRSKAVATSTSTEARRIERLSPKLAPIAVTGLGVPTALAEAAPRRPAGLEGVAEFALTVGRLNVRKNLESLLLGAARSGRVSAATPLLVVGSAEHSGVASELPPTVDALRADGRVRFLGRVDDHELAWLYAHAQLTASLTLDEGFGMTPLEAVHFASPLLVSDIPVHRETMAGYAAFVPPTAPAAQIGFAIDETWGHRPADAARTGILERYGWSAAVRALRAAC